MEYESSEELHFSWYLNELEEAGFIKYYLYQPHPYVLFEGRKYTYTKHLKTKSKIIHKTALQPHSYQADFSIIWNVKAVGIFFQSQGDQDPFAFPFIVIRSQDDIDTFRSVVDVKGTFNKNNTHRIFSIDQKWIYSKYKIYVQKIIPVKLFARTFTPSLYLLTDKTNRKRKITYKPVKNLQSYVENKSGQEG